MYNLLSVFLIKHNLKIPLQCYFHLLEPSKHLTVAYNLPCDDISQQASFLFELIFEARLQGDKRKTQRKKVFN